MIYVDNYMDDGASAQARAVLAYMSDNTIEVSYNTALHEYDGRPEVARWHNCREQGYVAYLRCEGRQLNIAFFEHRNSDTICAIMWEQNTWPVPPSMANAEFGGIYKDKWDTSHDEEWGNAKDMADWIWEQFEEFWVKYAKAKEVDA